MATSTDTTRLQNTALLVIDMQRDFCSVGGYAHQAGMDVARLAGPITHITDLLNAARRLGLLVVHTREGHVPDLSDCPAEKMARSVKAGAPIGSMGPLGRLLVRGEYGHDFVDVLQPADGEIVLDKPGYGAFYATPLESILREHGIQSLVLCGVTTEVCVHSTLREAVDRGFRCTTVTDATASSEPENQAAALRMIEVEGNIFGAALSAHAVLDMWNHHAL